MNQTQYIHQKSRREEGTCAFEIQASQREIKPDKQTATKTAASKRDE
jgi:hypothetical protein